MRYLISKTKILLLIVVLSGLNMKSTVTAQIRYEPVTFCKFITQSKHMHSRYVEVDADLFNAMPHGLFLGDPSCPKRKLAIDYKTSGADSSVAALDELYLDNVGTIGRIAKGSFCGKIERDQATHRIYLRVHRVLHLQSTTSSVP